MNEMMIQEAVLDSVDQIELSEIFSEGAVILALSDAYVKSLLIQEGSNAVSFDGSMMIQEGKDDSEDASEGEAPVEGDSDATSGQKKGSKFLGKMKEMPSKIIEYIKKALLAIANFLQKNIGKFVIKNITVTSDKTDVMAAMKKAGCKFTGVDKDSDNNTVYSVAWPTIDYAEITKYIESYDPQSLNYSNFGKFFDRIVKATQKDFTSPTPFEGAGECARALKKVAAMCDKQLSELKKTITGDQATGKVDKSTAINAQNANALKNAANNASIALKNVTEGYKKTMDAYKAYKSYYKSSKQPSRADQ